MAHFCLSYFMCLAYFSGGRLFSAESRGRAITSWRLFEIKLANNKIDVPDEQHMCVSGGFSHAYKWRGKIARQMFRSTHTHTHRAPGQRIFIFICVECASSHARDVHMQIYVDKRVRYLRIHFAESLTILHALASCTENFINLHTKHDAVALNMRAKWCP